MGEFFLTLFIFVGVIAVTLLLFGGWAAMLTVKGIGRVFRIGSGVPTGGERACASPECRQMNPAAAKYCRRCGRAIV